MENIQPPHAEVLRKSGAEHAWPEVQCIFFHKLARKNPSSASLKYAIERSGSLVAQE
jgi:hypothetical protein